MDEQIKGQVINEWLSGFTRDEIAENNKIGAGTVSTNEWKKGIDSKDYDSIRELSVFLKGEGMTFNDLVSIVSLNIILKNWAPIFIKSNPLSQISLIHMCLLNARQCNVNYCVPI